MVENMNKELLDPDMPADALRLHMGELNANEVLVARAAIRWANTRPLPQPIVLRKGVMAKTVNIFLKP